ncbi:MAG: hypothetical protein HQ582_32945 [Planctomycetes bacterium]|nr:hypothetical protein [Planctomycetota bacterium]
MKDPDVKKGALGGMGYMCGNLPCRLLPVGGTTPDEYGELVARHPDCVEPAAVLHDLRYVGLRDASAKAGSRHVR